MARYFAPLLILTAILTGCGGDYREAAIGAVSEVLVVVDSNQHGSYRFNDCIDEAVHDTLIERELPSPGLRC